MEDPRLAKVWLYHWRGFVWQQERERCLLGTSVNLLHPALDILRLIGQHNHHREITQAAKPWLAWVGAGCQRADSRIVALEIRPQHAAEILRKQAQGQFGARFIAQQN